MKLDRAVLLYCTSLGRQSQTHVYMTLHDPWFLICICLEVTQRAESKLQRFIPSVLQLLFAHERLTTQCFSAPHTFINLLNDFHEKRGFGGKKVKVKVNTCTLIGYLCRICHHPRDDYLAPQNRYYKRLSSAFQQ
jgi:hypothetical protein